MAAAGYVIEFGFGALGIIPTNRAVSAIAQGPTANYTSVLNVIFLLVAPILAVRFLRTGGPAMLRMMNMPGDAMDMHDEHSEHSEHSEHNEMVEAANESDGG